MLSVARHPRPATLNGVFLSGVVGLGLLHALLFHADIGIGYLAMSLLPVCAFAGSAIFVGWMLARRRPRQRPVRALSLVLGASITGALAVFPWMLYYSVFTMAGNEALARRTDPAGIPPFDLILFGAWLYLGVLFAVALFTLLRSGKTAKSA